MAVETAAARVRTRVLTEAALCWLTLGAIVLWQIGVYVDVWYHLHRGFAIESFFTWPHALLYGGWAATGLVITAYLLESRLLGEPSGAWLPRGYPIALLGIALYGLGGAFDLAWHTIFGFEARQEAVLSPSHLWLLAGGSLTAFGFLEASVRRRAAAGRAAYRPRPDDLPVALGLGFLLRNTFFMIVYIGPFTIDFASGGTIAQTLPGYAGFAWADPAAQSAGAGGILLHSAILAPFLVAPLRALRLPGGAIAAIMLFDAILIVAATDLWRYLPAVAGAAVAGEALWAWVRRGGLGGPDREAGYWALGFVVPLVQFALYFALMAAFGGGVIWTAHLLAGLPVAAGYVGLVAACLAVPPRWLHRPGAPFGAGAGR